MGQLMVSFQHWAGSAYEDINLFFGGGKNYCSGAANRKPHQKMMIFYFEMLFLGQKFEFRDNQRHRWIGELLARRSVLSDFCRGAKLVKRNLIEKQLLNHQKVMISRPSKTYQSLVEKLLGPMSFFEENIAGTKFEKSQLSWTKTYFAGGEFYIKSYIGNTYPQIIVFR